MLLHSSCPSTSSASFSEISDNKPFVIQNNSSNFIQPSIDTDIQHSIEKLTTHGIVAKSVTVHDHNPPDAKSQHRPKLLETKSAPENSLVDNLSSYSSHNESPPAHLTSETLNFSENLKMRKPVGQFIDDLIEGL